MMSVAIWGGVADGPSARASSLAKPDFSLGPAGPARPEQCSWP